MKKILYLLAIPAAAVALSTSCSNLNTFPVFDDANAFVSFGETTASIAEDQGIIEIPVVLSSVKGISTSITFDVVDSTAKAGVDFVMPENKTLTFDSENRTQNIRIQIIDRDGDYTGDLVFKLVFNSTGSVTDGAANECIVTIQDQDHPLNYILGSYKATDATGASWEMILSTDPDDDSMVWFYDICNLSSIGWAADDMMYYGVVNGNTITVPLGQSSEYVYSNGNPVLLTGLAPADEPGYYNVDDEGNITITISDDGNRLEFSDEMPAIGGYIENAGILLITPTPITAEKL